MNWLTKERNWVRKTIITIWVLYLLVVVIFPLYIYSVRTNWKGLYGELPSLKQLENPDPNLSSELISADGLLLGKYFRENRSNATFDELSPYLVNALIATEDIRFEKHSGIDLKSLVRVASGVTKKVLTLGRSDLSGGGSTLTQQLAKNLFNTRDHQGKIKRSTPIIGILVVKTKEWVLSVILEQSYTKKELLSMYLNTVPFGSNSHGIKVATKTFFNKTPAELNPEEAALLAGIVQAPTRLSPIFNPDNAFERRNVVLNQMRKYNFLSQQAYDTLVIKPLDMSNYKVDNQNQGLATYFRSVIKWDLMAWANENGYDLWEDGLKIYTTIDSRMQEYAEHAVRQHMDTLHSQFIQHLEGKMPWIDNKGNVLEDYLPNTIKRLARYRSLMKKYDGDTVKVYQDLQEKKEMQVFSWDGEIDTMFSTIDSLIYYKHFLQTGFVAMDPSNGSIKAWVGGIDHRYFKYDHVRQGKRQPGSTFKPFVYTTAIDNGYTPCDEFRDAQITFEVDGDPPTWTPNNSNNKYTGDLMTLRQAMARSVNTITANVIMRVGPSLVVDYAHRLGIKSPLAPYPALSLGVSDVSLYEMVSAYCTFANEGVWTQPFYIARIEDKFGNILQEFVPQTREAISEETAYVMLHMLKGATEERGGTGQGIPPELRLDNEIGAKTGTTDNASDGWFIGVTHNLVAGAWVGGDDRSIHFRNWYLGQGARTAMPIWIDFMRSVYQDESINYKKGLFPKPVKPISIPIDCNGNSSEKSDSTYIEQIKLDPSGIG